MEHMDVTQSEFDDIRSVFQERGVKLAKGRQKTGKGVDGSGGRGKKKNLAANSRKVSTKKETLAKNLRKCSGKREPTAEEAGDVCNLQTSRVIGQ